MQAEPIVGGVPPNADHAEAQAPALPDLDETVDARKLAPFVSGLSTQQSALSALGVTFFQFSAGRKVMLSITGNEFYRARKHIEAHLKATGAMFSVGQTEVDNFPHDQKTRPKTYADVTNEEFVDLCETCVPEFELHVGGLAYICCHDPETLADVTANPKLFRRAVVKWLMQFTVEQLSEITKESLRRYADETIGADYEVVSTDGAPPRPN